MFNINEVGQKCIIQNLKISDVKKMMLWGQHKDKLYANYNFPILTNEEIIRWYKIKTSKKRMIMSIYNFDNEIVGYMTLIKINKIFKTATLGIVIDPDNINKGYGYDAINTLAKWYFSKIKFKKLILKVAMYNNRAYKVYKKLGFVENGTIYEEFLNHEVDVFSEKKYLDIRKYFKKTLKSTYIKCIKMQLSTISTE